MPKARTLIEAYKIFDPSQPLDGIALKEFYVPRQTDGLEGLLQELRLADTAGRKVKILLTGQKGCGKSTELRRLAKELGKQYVVVSFSLERENWPIASLGYEDVMLGIANALYRHATDEALLGASPAQLLGEVLDHTRRFMERVIFGLDPRPTQAPAAEIAAEVNLLAAKISTKFSTEPTERDQMRARLKGRMDELIDSINTLTGHIEQRLKRPVLIVVEDADKPDLGLALPIFKDYGRLLTRPEVSIIYTFPIGLYYSKDFAAIKSAFPSNFFLANIRLFQRLTHAQHPEGWAQMEALLRNRLSDELISPEAVQQLIENSGGVARVLVRLTQRAAVRASMRGPTAQITTADATASIEAERNDQAAGLTEADYTLLASYRDKPRRPESGNADVQNLLHALALLEYRNHDTWASLHPILLPIVNELRPPLSA